MTDNCIPERLVKAVSEISVEEFDDEFVVAGSGEIISEGGYHEYESSYEKVNDLIHNNKSTVIAIFSSFASAAAICFILFHKHKAPSGDVDGEPTDDNQSNDIHSNNNSKEIKNIIGDTDCGRAKQSSETASSKREKILPRCAEESHASVDSKPRLRHPEIKAPVALIKKENAEPRTEPSSPGLRPETRVEQQVLSRFKEVQDRLVVHGADRKRADCEEIAEELNLLKTTLQEKGHTGFSKDALLKCVAQRQTERRQSKDRLQAEFRSYAYDNMQRNIDRDQRENHHQESQSAMREDKDWASKLTDKYDSVVRAIWTAGWRGVYLVVLMWCCIFVYNCYIAWNQAKVRDIFDLLALMVRFGIYVQWRSYFGKYFSLSSTFTSLHLGVQKVSRDYGVEHEWQHEFHFYFLSRRVCVASMGSFMDYLCYFMVWPRNFRYPILYI